MISHYLYAMKNATIIRNPWLLAGGLILAAAMSRLLPHPYNFTPLGGMALFTGAVFRKQWFAFLVPFLALWMSDLVLNNLVYGHLFESFSWFGSLGTYLGFAGIFILGRLMITQVRPGRILITSILGSVLFFLISNGMVWAQGFLGYPSLYPLNPGGLMMSYTAGLPFFGGTLLGDLFYNTALFGAWHLAYRQQISWQHI